MTLHDYQQKVNAEFDEKFPCIQPGCDNHGTIANQIAEDEWEPQPCQYCHEQRLPYLAFLDTTLDNLLVEVEGLVEKGRVYGCYEGCACRKRIVDEITRFKGEDSKV